MKVRLFVTTRNRPQMLERCLSSVRENTSSVPHELTVLSDGDQTVVTERALQGIPDFFHVSKENFGLGPTVNTALSILRGRMESEDEFWCYLQDDTVVSPHWLWTLLGRFLANERTHNLYFASGHDAPEHDNFSDDYWGRRLRSEGVSPRTEIGPNTFLKPYIRATNMLARARTWLSMYPIPPVDVETGRPRGRPHDGIGSGVDWHFLRAHENSPLRHGGTNLVIPGLVTHVGADKSTWFGGTLPER